MMPRNSLLTQASRLKICNSSPGFPFRSRTERWASRVAKNNCSSENLPHPLATGRFARRITGTSILSSNSKRFLSFIGVSQAAEESEDISVEIAVSDRPTGSLFDTSPHNNNKPAVGPTLVGATGMIQRTFGPRSNAEGLLATGGAALAAHASFDPDYDRARDWIRHHAVGPAVLSPILIAGLTGALTEAAFPQAVITAQAMRHHRPLIVGVPVAATIQVVSVREARRLSSMDENDGLQPLAHEKKLGYNVVLRTAVTRVRDDCIIAEGSHELWVPDYCHM